MRAALSGYRERAAREAMGEAARADSRLYVEELRLTNFRNYERAAASFDERPVALVGDNGAGKTNLLEAVSLLGAGSTKSVIEWITTLSIIITAAVFIQKVYFFISFYGARTPSSAMNAQAFIKSPK